MIHPVCKDIITHLGINRFVETGTHLGETVAEVSTWFSELYPDFGIIDHKLLRSQLGQPLNDGAGREIYYPVFKNSKQNADTKLYSVDLDEQKQKALQTIFQSNPNIKLICNSSEKFIKKIIDNSLVTNNDRCFFYLDAHWGEYWPLRDEIHEILRLKRSIIVIDDFVVPFHPEAGFDVYGNKVCDWYYIRDLFKNSKPYIFYPKNPNSDKRGSVIIFVGYHKKELKFMSKLPCFNPIFKGDLFLTTTKAKLIHTKLYSFVRNHVFGEDRTQIKN